MRRHHLLLAVLATIAIAVVLVLLLGGEADDDRPPADRGGSPPAGDRSGGGGGPARGREPEPVGDGTVPGPHGRLVVGLSDQKPDMFGDPRFRRLGIRHVRLVVPWDAALTGDRPTAAWLEAARRGGYDVLVAFGHAVGAQCPADPCEAPSATRFARAFAAFRRRFPFVREFSTWNEPNHASQPVARRPGLVARYYDAIRAGCPRCTLLGADVVADSSAARWVRGFGRRPRRFGLHNYSDANRFDTAGTAAFLRLVDGEVWITETGGIVEFTTADGRRAFERDERRAARATRQMFELARSSPRIRRLYVYHWNAVNPPGRFDAGLVAADGRARPAYDVLRSEISR